jgi:hypothetical protein
MTELKEILRDKSKFDFFTTLAQIINLSPVNISSDEDKLTINVDNGKLKVLFMGQERIYEYDKWVEDFGNSLYREFNNDTLNINSEYNIQLNG